MISRYIGGSCCCDPDNCPERSRKRRRSEKLINHSIVGKSNDDDNRNVLNCRSKNNRNGQIYNSVVVICTFFIATCLVPVSRDIRERGTAVYAYSTHYKSIQHTSSRNRYYSFIQYKHHQVNSSHGGKAYISYRERSTRRFVLTTPEAIIEQASTTKLLDDLIDESVRTSARRPLMMQFDPSSGWIWKRWKGTVFSETWDACVYRMIYACLVFILCKSFPQTKELLSGFSILWGQLLSVTTFTLTFFVNQSYALWRKCSELSRSLQGRLHDMDMTLAAHATRMPSKNPSEPSKFTNESRQILEVVSRYVRLFNLLTYASFTRSHRPVLTPRGMRRLVERGLMTPLEREVLINAKLPATQRHNAVLLWILRTFIEGTKAGHFTGGAGFEQQFIEKAHVCRAAYGAIGDELQGRMPLAYAHIVQVLVDLVLALYPFMAYSSGMSGFVCVIGTGLLTIGYQGLVWFSTINIIRTYEVEHYSSQLDLPNYFSQADLAKQFLDPYDNENYGKGEDPLVVDTLIAETNAGSTRWMDGLAEMPVASQKIIDGDLTDYILPRRGYTVEELQLMLEEQKVQKEKREKEELERQKRKEQEEIEKGWAEAMIPALIDNNNTVSPTIGLRPYIILDGIEETAERMGSLFESTMSIAETVNTLTFSQNSNATSLQRDLVPEGTAPFITLNTKKKGSVNETVVPTDAGAIEVLKTDTVIVDVANDKSHEIIYHHDTSVPSPSTESAAREKIDLKSDQNVSVDDVAVDVVGTQSQMHTDPPPNTLEYYQQKIQEILEARRDEDIRLTTAVVMSAPGAEIYNEDDVDGSITPSVETNGTATLSDIDDYEVESFKTDADILMTIEEILEAEKQEQWETQAILNARPGADSIEVLEEENDLLSMVLNATVSDRLTVGSSEMINRSNTTEFDVVPDIVLDLADESMDIFETEVPIEDERVELLETEAILKAPPGANSIDVSDEELQLIRTKNSTSIDDLAILEMDDIDSDPREIDDMTIALHISDDGLISSEIENIADIIVTSQEVTFANESDPR